MESVIPANNENYFKRQRAVRACTVCHDRKVRCDAFTLGMPCTNCKAFGFECKIPEPKRKKNHLKVNADPPRLEPTIITPQTSRFPMISPKSDAGSASITATTGPGPTTLPLPVMSQQQATYSLSSRTSFSWLDDHSRSKLEEETLVNLLDKDLQKMRIRDSQVRYIGDSSAMALILNKFKADPDPEEGSDTNFYHFGSTKNKIVGDIDPMDLEVLKVKGAFDLPSKEICDELLAAYFSFMHPMFPIVDKKEFYSRYNDSSDPPSLLLIQAMLLAATHVVRNPQLRDSKTGDSHKTANVFYKRGKALFDSKYEVSRLVLVQSALLLSVYWEGRDNMDNTWYWIGVAIRIAQEVGMHRSVKASHISESSKKMWRRIWWTLFIADRLIASSLGRPMMINVDDCDIELPLDSDFGEDEKFAQTILTQMVKLAEIMGLVLTKHYTAASKKQKPHSKSIRDSPDVASLDMALASWMLNLPPELHTTYYLSPHQQNISNGDNPIDFLPGGLNAFIIATLHMVYYTTLILLHRDYVSIPVTDAEGKPTGYPSRNIVLTAANMITRIIEQFTQANICHCAGSFTVHCTFSAIMVHMAEISNSDVKVAEAASAKVKTLMYGLKELSKSWWIAGSLYKLFEALMQDSRKGQKLKSLVKISGAEIGKRKHSDENTGKVKSKPGPPKGKNKDKEERAKAVEIARKDLQSLAQSVHYHFATGPNVSTESIGTNRVPNSNLTTTISPKPSESTLTIIPSDINTSGGVNDATRGIIHNGNAIPGATTSPNTVVPVNSSLLPTSYATNHGVLPRTLPQDVYGHLYTRGENDEPMPASMLEHFQAGYLFPANASRIYTDDNVSSNNLTFMDHSSLLKSKTHGDSTSPISQTSCSLPSPSKIEAHDVSSTTGSSIGSPCGSSGNSTVRMPSQFEGNMPCTGHGENIPTWNIGEWYSYFFDGAEV